MTKARVVSLDMDGTLYRVRRLRVAWRLRFERGLLLAMVAAREKVRHEGPFDDQAALEWREAELVAPSFNLSTEACAAQLSDLRADLPEALTRGIRPFPGVAGALEAAHARGLKLAVVSDYDPADKLHHLGLGDLPWAALIGADQLGALKPHRRVFDHLAEQLSVPIESIVHVGDREDIDVAGALAAGCRAWRFATKPKTTSAAEHVFRRWTIDLFTSLWDPTGPSSGR